MIRLRTRIPAATLDAHDAFATATAGARLAGARLAGARLAGARLAGARA
ncbi:MAG: hypothetical protein M0Z82_15430 [Actinomycetota bacterium]|nr:hypothetical protein [Actinomycetota bacterium]